MAKSNYYDEDMDSQSDSSSTALLPKSALGGKRCEVGDEIVFKVTAIHDDEVQVECTGEYDEPEKEDNPEEEAEEKPSPGSAPETGEEEGDAVAAPSDSDGMYA